MITLYRKAISTYNNKMKQTKKEEATNKKVKQKNKLTQAVEVKDYTFQSIPGGSNDVKITFLAIPKNQTSKETTNFKKKRTDEDL